MRSKTMLITVKLMSCMVKNAAMKNLWNESILTYKNNTGNRCSKHGSLPMGSQHQVDREHN